MVRRSSRLPMGAFALSGGEMLKNNFPATAKAYDGVKPPSGRPRSAPPKGSGGPLRVVHAIACFAPGIRGAVEFGRRDWLDH